MTYLTLKNTLTHLVSIGWVYLPHDQMVDLQLEDEQEVDRAAWEAYDWEIETQDTLPEGVEQTNFASPKPDWSVLVANQVKG